MKIKTKAVLVNLKGEELKFKDGEKEKALTLGNAVANILLDCKTGGKHKLYLLSNKFYSDKEVEVDSVDLRLIKDAVEANQTYNNIVSGQILEILENIKEKKDGDK